MFSKIKVEIVTDSSGNATVYLEHGINGKPEGFLVLLRYAPGDMDTGADLTITGEDSGIPIMTKSNAGTSTVFFYPRALLNAVADGAASTNASEFIPINKERIKVIVAQGGNVKTGSIEAWLINKY